MNVGELRAALDKFEDDTPIVLAKDEEGNGFSPLAEAMPGMYEATSTWSGEHYLSDEQRRETAANENADPDDYCEAPESAVEAVFLWPIN